ncbi:MAG: archaeosortase/exosortase family protein [Candidatus Hydrogenedentes bacterium]|nr:archaeosortase/exosortase family protein [Candidatus Hydrogenedentota bacterium]
MTEDAPKAHGNGGPAPRATRRSALTFAAAFLVITGALLTAGRYAVGTLPMRWYLFQVARHTSFALELAGHSSQLENLDAYEGREAEIRASLAGSDQIDLPESSRTAPLTAWEIWSYRCLRARAEIDAESCQLATLSPSPPPDSRDPRALIAYIRQGVRELEHSIRPSGENGATRAAEPGLAVFLSRAQESLEIVGENVPEQDDALAAQLREFAQHVSEWRNRQVAFLKARAARLAYQQAQLGPLVCFVASEPVRPAEPDGVTAPDSAPSAPPDGLSFRFSVVPDCGALPAMSIFFAAVVAFPVRWRKRLVGIVLGLPLLYAVNVLRLACLAFLGAYTGGGDLFTFAHEYGWQGIYLVFVVGVWLLWAEFIVRRIDK